MTPVLLEKCNVKNVLIVIVKESYGWLLRGQDRLGTLYFKVGFSLMHVGVEYTTNIGLTVCVLYIVLVTSSTFFVTVDPTVAWYVICL